jgi:hypothetical protein
MGITEGPRVRLAKLNRTHGLKHNLKQQNIESLSMRLITLIPPR